MRPAFDVVLVRPDIAGNTGQIGRSCMALGCKLHLVHPLGYQITDSNLKRAGLDYWPMLLLQEHGSVEDWLASLGSAGPVWLFTTKAERSFSPAEISPGSTLVFGSETRGLPDEVMARFVGAQRRIAMDPRARSLNLSASVAMVLGSLLLK